MITIWAIGLRVISAIIVSFAALFMKMGSKVKLFKDYRIITKNSVLLFGIFLYVVSSIISIIAYRGGDLSLLLPINALSYVGSMVLAVVILKEKMNVKKYLGISLIVIGLVLIIL